MNFKITKNAFFYLKNELSLQPGDTISIFVRYGGFNTRIPGFSLGISKDDVVDIGASCEMNDISFVISSNDLWYFEEKNLTLRISKNELNFEVK